MRDNHAPACAQHGHTAWHGSIVSKSAITMQFDPVSEAAFDVIQGKGPLSVTRHLNPLPCCQIIVNMAARFAKFRLKFFHR